MAQYISQTEAIQFYNDVEKVIEKGQGSVEIGESMRVQFNNLIGTSPSSVNEYRIGAKSTYNELLVAVGMVKVKRGVKTNWWDSLCAWFNS